MNTTPQGAKILRGILPAERKRIAPSAGPGQWFLVRWPDTGIQSLYEGYSYRSITNTLTCN